MNQNLHRGLGYTLVLAVFSLLTACGGSSARTAAADLYGQTIAGLADDEAFAVVDAGSKRPVLLVSSQIFDDGAGNQASVFCDVYYAADDKVIKAGTIDDPAITQPLACDSAGIYAAGDGWIRRYEISSEDGFLYPSEEDIQTLTENMQEAAVVHFHYGASDDH